MNSSVVTAQQFSELYLNYHQHALSLCEAGWEEYEASVSICLLNLARNIHVWEESSFADESGVA